MSKSCLDAAAILMFCLWLLPRGAAGTDDFQVRYQQAVAAYKRGGYAEAVTHFQRAYDLRPLPRLLINIGRAHLRLGHRDQALAFFRLYLRSDPQAPPALRAEVELAITQAEAVRPPPEVEADASSLQVLLDRGENLFQRERYPEAMQAWEAAYAIRPIPWLLYRLGQVHQRIGHPEAALAYYLRYLDHDAEQDPRTTADVRAQIRLLRAARSRTGPPRSPARAPAAPP